MTAVRRTRLTRAKSVSMPVNSSRRSTPSSETALSICRSDALGGKIACWPAGQIVLKTLDPRRSQPAIDLSRRAVRCAASIHLVTAQSQQAARSERKRWRLVTLRAPPLWRGKTMREEGSHREQHFAATRNFVQYFPFRPTRARSSHLAETWTKITCRCAFSPRFFLVP